MAKNETLGKIHELQPSFQTTTEQITIRAITSDQQSRQQATPLPAGSVCSISTGTFWSGQWS